MIVEENEYHGKPILVLKKRDDDKYPFSFGLAKARIIIEHFDDIKSFVEKHDPEGDTPTP